MPQKNLLIQIKTLSRQLTNWMEYHNPDPRKPRTTQMLIMEYLACHPEEDVLQRDLEKYLRISRASVSDVLSTMEKNGMIRRSRGKRDARTRTVALEERAKQRMKEGDRALEKLMGIATKGIPPSQLKTFEEVLDQMIRNMEERSPS